MKAGLTALARALDAAAAPVRFFIRDDDAGWRDEHLFRLLDCVAGAGASIDLAVIPQACSKELARELRAHMDAAPGRLGVHQHGFSHTNHETVDRKCEFGRARGIADKRLDLVVGRERLRALFGARLDPVFTPPWNRCCPSTPALLAELGFAALSRDCSVQPQSELPEVPVDVDWCKQRRLATQRDEDAGNRIAHAVAQCVGASGGTLGLMLHHAEMDGHDLLLLETLIAATSGHPNAQWTVMADILRDLDVANDRQAVARIAVET